MPTNPNNLQSEKFLFRSSLAAVYRLHYAIKYGAMRVGAYFFVEPAFRYRCASVGCKLQVWNVPEIHGCPSIHIGEQVNIYGRLKIEAPTSATSPRLRIGNSVEIGNRVSFVVTSQIVIEDFVNIAQRSTISDIDLFSPGQAAPESQPVTTRICRGAWIGIGSVITRGVTVGEGAIIGSGSVVTNNIPPFSVALGNPARVIVKDTRTSG